MGVNLVVEGKPRKEDGRKLLKVDEAKVNHPKGKPLPVVVTALQSNQINLKCH